MQRVFTTTLAQTVVLVVPVRPSLAVAVVLPWYTIRRIIIKTTPWIVTDTMLGVFTDG